jgi:hypothetical protein
VKSNRQARAPLEEALANSYALHKVCSEITGREQSKVKNAIMQFMEMQPDGYKHAEKFPYNGKKWKRGMNELLDKILNQEDSREWAPWRIIATHVLFDGVDGNDDWLEEYYAGQVPCKILNTGFAQGRFSESTKVDGDFGIWCVSSKFHGKFKNLERDTQKFFRQICREYSDLTNGKGIKGDYKNFRLNSNFTTEAKRLFRSRGTKKDVFYFRFYEKKYRAYHEINSDDEEVLILTEKKKGQKLHAKTERYLHKKQRSGILKHEDNCKNKL